MNVVFSLTTGVLYIAAEVESIDADVDLTVTVGPDSGGAHTSSRA